MTSPPTAAKYWPLLDATGSTALMQMTIKWKFKVFLLIKENTSQYSLLLEHLKSRHLCLYANNMPR